MKTREQIIAELNARMVEEFEIDESLITPDALIFDTLELDSISLIDIIGIVRVNFGIKMAKEDLPQIKTFSNLYDYVESHQ